MKKLLGKVLLIFAIGVVGIVSAVSLTGCAQPSYSKGFDEAD